MATRKREQIKKQEVKTMSKTIEKEGGKMTELITVNLDKERTIRLGLKGMIEFEKLTGQNLLKGFNLKDLTLEDIAALIWACLIHEDKELKYDDVLYMVDSNNFDMVTKAITAYVVQSAPALVKGGEASLAEKP